MKRFTIILLLFVLLLAPLGLHQASAQASVSDVILVGPGSAGGTTVFGVTSGLLGLIGTNSSNQNTWYAQSFETNAGTLSQIFFRTGASSGSPGNITWELRSDNSSRPGSPGTILQSAAVTPVAGNNTISVASGITLNATTTYWLLFRLSSIPSSANNNWQLGIDTSGHYSGGFIASSADGGSNWDPQISSNSMWASVTTTTPIVGLSQVNTKLGNSIKAGAETFISGVQLYLKKVGTPSDTLTLRVEYDNANIPSGILVNTNATTTVAESSLGTSYSYIDFVFPAQILLKPEFTYDLVLSTGRVDTTNYISWGVNALCSLVNLKTYISSVWQNQAYTAFFLLDVASISSTSTPTVTYTPSATYTPSPTLTSTPNVYFYTTLTSGQAASVKYEITAGEALQSSIGLLLVGLLIFGLFLTLARRRND